MHLEPPILTVVVLIGFDAICDPAMRLIHNDISFEIVQPTCRPISPLAHPTPATASLDLGAPDFPAAILVMVVVRGFNARHNVVVAAR